MTTATQLLRNADIRHTDSDASLQVGDLMFGALTSVIIENLGDHKGWDGELRVMRPYRLVRVRPATEAEVADHLAKHASWRAANRHGNIRSFAAWKVEGALTLADLGLAHI